MILKLLVWPLCNGTMQESKLQHLTRWVHRSPEGYINNIHKATMTPESHFITLSQSGEKVHAYVCVHVLCEFFISVARRLNLIPRGFFNSARTWTHDPEHRCTREEDGSNNIMVGERHVPGSWKRWHGWTLIDETAVWTSISRRQRTRLKRKSKHMYYASLLFSQETAPTENLPLNMFKR